MEHFSRGRLFQQHIKSFNTGSCSKKTNDNTHLYEFRHKLSLAAIGITLPLVMSSSVFAASGDFSNTDFAAAAPFTYNHSTGGGAYNDRTVGEYNDVTEQLLGAQFSCSDTVTFLANIEVSDTPVDALQTIELDLRFLADSTGQSGAAISDIVSVSVNYGQWKMEITVLALTLG
ncbi:hypothetical protein OFO16_15685 [Vibrio natriegens]|uniref:hypothetical protein n=1 Tax=Vibrio natriegens TaxID=691 RepID=UPI0021E932A4|nr:hypothetical protein [Vibrio natriegens]UYI49468.1 hypothetical protein OFO16_15685 [Vibrio natriegens]